MQEREKESVVPDGGRRRRTVRQSVVKDENQLSCPAHYSLSLSLSLLLPDHPHKSQLD